MSSWWQKRLLRYGLRAVLSRSGILDDQAINLDSLDISLGQKSVVELKDVGLNIQRLSQLAQLPPCLRLQTARVLSLRLTIPADIYQSSIVAEVDGVEVVARLEEVDETPTQPEVRRNSSPTSARTPQHRKMHRRLHSPPPYDPGGLPYPEDGAHIPTAREVAESFLENEPSQERKELEATLAANPKSMEDSIASESSEGSDVGTGTGMAMPGFLADFLQGVVNRFQLHIHNVQVKLETEIAGELSDSIPITLRLKVRVVELDKLETSDKEPQSDAGKRRSVHLSDIALELLSDATVLVDLSDLPSHSSSYKSRSSAPTQTSEESLASAADAGTRRSSASTHRSSNHAMLQSSRLSTKSYASQSRPRSPLIESHASMTTIDADRVADAGEVELENSEARSSELDIQAGDDNVSWGSRRSKSSPPSDDLWRSMVSEDDLPESLVLAPERGHTSRTHSSRGSSPYARRAPSPFNTNIQGPGSWPRVDESPQRHRQQQGFGSWPTLDQGQHGAIEPLGPVLAAAADAEITDNKKAALEQVETEEQVQITEAHPVPAPDARKEEEGEEEEEEEEDMSSEMLESRVFSHEEAQSMYMSAMTNSPTMDMPGGWGADTQSVLPVHNEEQSNHSASLHAEMDGQASGNITPRAQTPGVPAAVANASEVSCPKVIRELINIDSLSISLATDSKETNPRKEDAEVFLSPYGAKSAQAARGVPGAFSAYSESSRRRGTASTYGESSSSMWATRESLEEPQTESSEPAIVICLGSIRAQIDISTGRLLYALGTRAVSALKTTENDAPKPVQSVDPSMSIHLDRLTLSARETIDAEGQVHHPSSQLRESSGHAVMEAVVTDVELSMTSETRFSMGTVKVLLGGEDLLTFNEESNVLTASQVLMQDTPDITVNITQNKTLANRRPVTDIAVHTASISLLLDLTVIDDTFDSFGGLSGMLELGSSILSESAASSPVATKTPKGVRFAGDAEQAKVEPEMKLNARIRGITVKLKAAPCSAVLQTSTVKAIYREGGTVAATVERVLLSGPFVPTQPSHAPVAIDLASVRIEYFLQPQDKDLERLLSLLTPSKDKYDSDDDILIDTLLRQRRKGGLLRTAIADIKIRVDNWECLSVLTQLQADLAKLSAVTKYLPEDDRPGVLTLVRIKDAEAQMPVNERFGTTRLAFQDLHLAHVGLPALLAFSIGNVNASQVDGPELIHAMSPYAGSEGLPMVMARMLGDEEEPTVKVKLFNACLEYSVPVLLDLTGMDKEAEVEQVINEMAQSIAGLAMDERTRTQASDLSSSPQKRINISLLVHDSAIGLTPQKLHSKALLVLTDTHLATVVPPGEVLSAKLEFRKASMFITDRAANQVNSAPARTGATLNPASTTHRLSTLLTSQGFVSIGSIMSATIVFRAEDNTETGSKTVEVDVNNELLLLETCADSTQTLFATLGALAPTTPPSKQPKYLTEPMTIEDMMASFTGDPFEKPDLPPETLFDVETDHEEEPDMLLGMSGLSETADLLAASEMTSSLYGPVGGVFGMDDHDEDGEDYPKTVESLLEEEDPFEMPTSPTDLPLGDAALLRDLKRQCKPALRDEPVDLGLYEIADLGYDALGSGQQALGTRERFNAPFPGNRGGKKQQSNLPFRLRLRDCHVIWHIYDGYDWQRTRDGIVEAVEQVEMKAEERRARRRQSLGDREDDESVIGDFLFNSIYIGVPADHDAQELRRQINRNIDEMISETESVPVSGMSRPTTYSASGQPRGQRQRRRLKLGRSRSHKIAFELKGVAADVLVYAPGGGDLVSSVDLRIKDLEIFDKVPSSTWRKFLTHLDTDSSTREMSKPMFHIQMDNVKTLESHSASEIVLKVSVLPLRLHVDQDALDFITRFFEFKDESLASAGPPGEQPFIQRVEVDTVDMCLDYKPKNIDYVGLRSGRTTEFMNFITLDASNIRLKHAIVYGLRGFDTLHQTLNDVWMPDIQRNQLPTILAGLAPVRSLVNLGSGVRDVVAIPIREYRKDGRIVRSIQKGAFHFGKTTASELARLGAKVALGTQNVLSTAEQFLSPEIAGSSRRPTSIHRTTDQGWHDIASDDEEPEQRAISAYANQPLGVLPGLVSARRHLEHDLLTAKDALIAVRGEFFESRGPGDAAAAVARHAPTVILRPIIGATRAVGTTLLGVGNQIDRGNVRKVEDKYKPR